MSWADGTAIVLVLCLTAYAWLGLADYGAGLWDLLAGGVRRGRRPRALIDAAITPVWEANHVWLIFVLVLCWSGFGAAFAAIMTTLYLPLAVALLGIVLRGANFAIRKDAARARRRHQAGWVFGVASLATPFCLGAVLGSVAAGRVPPGNAAGNQITSWWNPVSVTVGLLAVAVGGFLAAVYLTAEAHRRGLTELRRYFRLRAAVAGVVGLLLGAAALVALHADARRMFDRLVDRGAVLLAVGVLALATAVLLTGRKTLARAAGAAGVAALVWAWAVAQYPYLLPFSLAIADGAGAPVSQRFLLGTALVALLLVLPAFLLLFTLDQRGELEESYQLEEPRE